MEKIRTRLDAWGNWHRTAIVGLDYSPCPLADLGKIRSTQTPGIFVRSNPDAEKIEWIVRRLQGNKLYTENVVVLKATYIENYSVLRISNELRKSRYHIKAALEKTEYMVEGALSVLKFMQENEDVES